MDTMRDSSYIIHFLAPLPLCFIFAGLIVSKIPHSDQCFLLCPSDVYVVQIRLCSINDSLLVLVIHITYR